MRRRSYQWSRRIRGLIRILKLIVPKRNRKSISLRYIVRKEDFIWLKFLVKDHLRMCILCKADRVGRIINNISQKLVLKVTKSKNREIIKEQRFLNKINHPNIMFSYGLIYPQKEEQIDLKQLDKYLPKLDSNLKKSVDKLMKRNKYGELEYLNFEKSKTPLLKNFFEKDHHKPIHIKASVSPNHLKNHFRPKKFNFSQTFKEYEIKNIGNDSVDDTKEIERTKTTRINSKKPMKGLLRRKTNFSQLRMEKDYKRKGTGMSELRKEMKSQNYKMGESHVKTVPKKKTAIQDQKMIYYKKLRVWKLDIMENLDLAEYEERLKKKKFLPSIHRNKDISYEETKEYLKIMQNNNFGMLVEYCGERTLDGKSD